MYFYPLNEKVVQAFYLIVVAIEDKKTINPNGNYSLICKSIFFLSLFNQKFLIKLELIKAKS